MKRVPIVLVAAVLSACASMAPEYQRPAAPVAQDWPEGPASAAAAAAPAEAADAQTARVDMPWRDFIADDRLERLIDIALEHNRDLRIATLNIERARPSSRSRMRRASRRWTPPRAARTSGCRRISP